MEWVGPAGAAATAAAGGARVLPLFSVAEAAVGLVVVVVERFGVTFAPGSGGSLSFGYAGKRFGAIHYFFFFRLLLFFSLTPLLCALAVKNGTPRPTSFF